jgi:RNA polymerase nonessential primary-like sigma factor
MDDLSVLTPTFESTDALEPEFEPSIIDLQEADFHEPVFQDVDFQAPDLKAISLEIDELDLEEAIELPATGRRTTDLVRMYLQEIGRVQLLGRDEEVTEAQRVQRYMALLEHRNTESSLNNRSIALYVKLIDTRDRLASNLGHRPSLERWASDCSLTVAELKPAMAEGKLGRRLLTCPSKISNGCKRRDFAPKNT